MWKWLREHFRLTYSYTGWLPTSHIEVTNEKCIVVVKSCGMYEIKFLDPGIHQIATMTSREIWTYGSRLHHFMKTRLFWSIVSHVVTTLSFLSFSWCDKNPLARHTIIAGVDYYSNSTVMFILTIVSMIGFASSLSFFITIHVQKIFDD